MLHRRDIPGESEEWVWCAVQDDGRPQLTYVPVCGTPLLPGHYQVTSVSKAFEFEAGEDALVLGHSA